MQVLSLPAHNFSIKKDKDKLYIFDDFRKKWIVLTPEEWVRQHLLMFLTLHKNYPKSLIAIERLVKVNGLSQRFDAGLFNSSAKPIAVIECKAPSVKITESTLSQAIRYNKSIKAPYLILTNGLETFCGIIDLKQNNFSYLKDIPDYNEI